MRRTFVVGIAIFALAACSEKPSEDATEPAAPAMEEPAAPVEPEPPSAEPEQAYLTFVTGLRRQPSEAKRVEVEGKTKKQHNWMSSLYRGEELTVSAVEEEWAKVLASDGTEGWVKKNGLLPTEGVSLATVFETTKTFNRPDLLAQNTTRVVDPATLLFVLKTKDQFTEVNYYGQGTAWVLSDKLTADPMEISAAKLLAKVQWLKSRKDPDADEVMELARSQFGDSKLVGMADDEGKVGSEDEEEEAAPEGEETADPGEESASDG